MKAAITGIKKKIKIAVKAGVKNKYTADDFVFTIVTLIKYLLQSAQRMELIVYYLFALCSMRLSSKQL